MTDNPTGGAGAWPHALVAATPCTFTTGCIEEHVVAADDTGVNRLDTVQRALREGFGFVAMGRALLREPDLLLRWQAGDTREALCIHCNKCMPTIYRGTHCVLVAPEARPGHNVG